MTLLIGHEGEEATSVSANGKELAVQFEATVTGTLEELHIIPAKTWTGTAAFLGIAEDNAGAPGTVSQSVESASIPKEKVPYALAGFSVKVTKGVKYWLIAKTNTAATTAFLLGKTGGTSTVRVATKTGTKIETLTEWEAAQARGPASFWGTGKEEEGAVKGKASGAILLTGTAKGIAAQRVEGKATGPLLLTGTAQGTAAQVVTGKATGALSLTGTATGSIKAVVSGKATGALLLTGTSHGQAAGTLFGKASGSMLLAGTSSATLRAVVLGKGTGALALTGTAKGATKAVVSAKGLGALVFAGTANGTVGGAVVMGKAFGVLTLTGTAHTGELPCHMRITNWKAAKMTVTNWKAVHMTLVNRKGP